MINLKAQSLWHGIVYRHLPSCPTIARTTNCSDVLTDLDAAEKDEHKNDEEHCAQKTRGTVAPTRAVRPTREGADEQEDKDDEQDCSKRHGA